MTKTLFNDAATQTDFTLIKHRGLAGSYRRLWAGKDHPDVIVIQRLDAAGDVLLAIAGLDGAVERVANDLAIDPVQLAGDQAVGVEAGMVVTLSHDQDVALDIKCNDSAD